ncbi:MAG: 2-dehydro-3-deoxygalactonokinase [Betaproteobacteria bacterium]
MVNTAALAPRLVALDWGSTRLRAWLLGDGGAILAERQNGDGASTIVGGAEAFDRALTALAGDWLAPGLPALACGMVGSAHGWREAPYVACPARLDTLHEHAVEVRTSGGATLRIVPGLIDEPAESTPDVMRGEETQVVGLLHALPALADGGGVLMPGTHAKWVRLRHGAVAGFRTRMTGEVWALLRSHSVLARLMTPDDGGWHAQAFEAGVLAARLAEGADLLGQLFAVRTLGLTQRWPAAALSDHLSGMLIGHELVAGLREADGLLALVGEPALCRRYVHALETLGARAASVHDNTACAGLWQLAAQAGWVQQ